MPKKPIEVQEYRRWDLVFVTWIDAGSHDDWTNDEDTNFDTPLCKSVGFWYKETETAIVVSNTHDTANDNVACSIIIPKGMIQSIERLAKVE